MKVLESLGLPGKFLESKHCSAVVIEACIIVPPDLKLNNFHFYLLDFSMIINWRMWSLLRAN